jgi:hypothetical protein
MRFILFLLAVVALLVGIALLSVAKSAIHEIEGFIVLLICAVLLSGAAIVDSLVHHKL